ncbi:hypothetical protein [Nonomuraea sp. NPDC049480]|uniref:hypothetical protein n=1 Tax=Nonomuraea sp. NPDC049480 TaxID=3364353 RepID=UPI0037898B71
MTEADNTPSEPADTPSEVPQPSVNPLWVCAIALMVITALLFAHFGFSIARGLDGQYRILEETETGLIIDTPGGPAAVSA